MQKWREIQETGAHCQIECGYATGMYSAWAKTSEMSNYGLRGAIKSRPYIEGMSGHPLGLVTVLVTGTSLT